MSWTPTVKDIDQWQALVRKVINFSSSANCTFSCTLQSIRPIQNVPSIKGRLWLTDNQGKENLFFYIKAICRHLAKRKTLAQQSWNSFQIQSTICQLQFKNISITKDQTLLTWFVMGWTTPYNYIVVENVHRIKFTAMHLRTNKKKSEISTIGLFKHV